MKNRIQQKLEAAFSPLSILRVINDSHKHKGHAGFPETGDSYFKVRIKAPAFETLSQVASHQLIYKTLDAKLKEALQLGRLSLGFITSGNIYS